MSCETCKKLRVKIKKWLNIEPELEVGDKDVPAGLYSVYQVGGLFGEVSKRFSTREEAQEFIDAKYKIRPREYDWAFTIVEWK